MCVWARESTCLLLCVWLCVCASYGELCAGKLQQISYYWVVFECILNKCYQWSCILYGATLNGQLAPRERKGTHERKRVRGGGESYIKWNVFKLSAGSKAKAKAKQRSSSGQAVDKQCLPSTKCSNLFDGKPIVTPLQLTPSPSRFCTNEGKSLKITMDNISRAIKVQLRSCVCQFPIKVHF